MFDHLKDPNYLLCREGLLVSDKLLLNDEGKVEIRIDFFGNDRSGGRVERG